MATTPNTTFVSGAIYTAAQANAFPFGAMTALVTNTTTNAAVTTEATQITSASFTPIANRYYKITYFEPQINGTTASGAQLKVKNGATILNTGFCYNATTGFGANGASVIAVVTLAATPTVITATLSVNGGTSTATRSATQFAFLLIEDIGQA